MPAIHLARLKIQATELVLSASEPESFCYSYHQFLDYYADRTYRPGKVGEPPPLLPAYNVPKQVSRALEKELGAWAGSNREAALKLADALWTHQYLEFRVTAGTLIGQVSPLPVRSIFSRVEAWIQPGTEERLVDVLIGPGLRRILIEYKDLYLQQVMTWLRSKINDRKRLGLLACLPLLAHQDFEDYPLVFKQLDNLMRSENNKLRNDTLVLLKALVANAPDETAFFLERQLRSSRENSQIAWYVRNILNEFSTEMRTNLLKVLMDAEQRGNTNP